MPLHLLLLKLSDVPHANLFTEFNKHLILHLETAKTFITDVLHIREQASKWTSPCRSHQVHAVSQVVDLLLTGLDDPLDVIDARAKVGQFTLELRLLLHDTN